MRKPWLGGLLGGLLGGVSGGVGGLAFGLTSGLTFGLKYGGDAVIQHMVLRVLLWRSGVMPWNIAAFLDSCARRTLVRQVGGGYVFLHRMLLEYFAEL